MGFIRRVALLCCMVFSAVQTQAGDDGYPDVRVAFADGVSGLPGLTYASEAAFARSRSICICRRLASRGRVRW